MCGCALIQDNISKCTYIRTDGVYGGNVKITAFIKIYKTSVSVHSECEDEITPSPTVKGCGRNKYISVAYL
jgi:MoaA/NifB/PqqE/SkfB family radical SAM enzyme